MTAGSVGLHSFLHLVRASAGVEGSPACCVGAAARLL